MAPAEFDRCVANGGKVRTVNPKPGTYLHVCYLDGKSYAGEVKHKQEVKSAYKRAAGKK